MHAPQSGTVVITRVRRSPARRPGMKRCPGCKRWKSLDRFGSHKGEPSGKANRCRPCRSVQVVAWVKASERGRLVRLNATHRYRAHRAGVKVSLTTDELQEVWNEAKARGDCEVCHRALNFEGKKGQPDAVTLDHITALKDGGGHVKDNVRFICAGCNRSPGKPRVRRAGIAPQQPAASASASP